MVDTTYILQIYTFRVFTEHRYKFLELIND